MATLKDISREIGVSVTQVSRALNGYPDVNEQTRSRVLEAAERMGYHPNLSARRLVTGRSGIVGLVMPGMPDELSERMYMRIVGGMSSHFAKAGLQFIFRIADPEEDIVDVHRRLIDSGALDGFVIMDLKIDDWRIGFLQERGVPFVLHGRTGPTPDYPFFDIDNRGVAERLTRYLVERGHRRIAFVNGREGAAFAHQRLDGYRATLGAAGIDFEPGLHRMAPMTEGHGMLSTVDFFSGSGPAPTAVICSNTLIAKGVLQALRALGRSVPADVSVVAHDDLLPDAASGTFEPALTCTYAPLQESWRPLAEFLIGALDAKPLASVQRLGKVEFKERDSVAWR